MNKRSGRCPQCGQPAILETDNPWRPFCSQRCKLIDLGQWFGERYVIAAEEKPGSEEHESQPRRQ